MKMVGYLRVTRAQADEGFGLDVQQESIEKCGPRSTTITLCPSCATSACRGHERLPIAKGSQRLSQPFRTVLKGLVVLCLRLDRLARDTRNPRSGSREDMEHGRSCLHLRPRRRPSR